MLPQADFIRLSLELNLFFLRIMKEHSFFLKVSFPAKNASQIEIADYFINQFTGLLHEAVRLSNGVLPADVLRSGQYFTRFTIDAEQATQFYTGVPFDTALSQAEESLQPGSAQGMMPAMEGMVSDLNRKAMENTAALATFKNRVLSDVLACRMYTTNYPLLIDHIMREAVFFHGMLQKLQNREELRTEKELLDQEVFWNRIMAEHAKFIRGLLDPTETTLFDAANLFGKQFDDLTVEAQRAQNNPAIAPKVTNDSMAAAQRIRDFKAAGTSGILSCKIRSIILPLLGDHVLREANHYITVLTKGA